MKKSSNIIVIGAGVLLMIVAFLGVVLYNRLMNPEPNYVLAAAVNIEANTDLVSLGRDSFIMIDVPNKATASTFVTENDFLKMQAKGGQFVRSVRQNEPIKYTDISSEANPVAANAITLGINDPNKVVMTIDVEGIAPNGIQQGDYIDIVAVTTIEGEDVYENELANLLAEARKAALAQIESAENINTAIDFKDLDTNTAYSDSYSFENVMDTFGSFSFGGDSSQTAESDQNMFTVSAPSMTEELEKAANELSDKADALEEKLEAWNEFLETYGSIDPVALSEQLNARFFVGPMAKVLVNGAQIIHVNRADDSYTSNVKTLDVLIPREDIEWVAMANAGGMLRVAVLPVNANPNGSGATTGASMQDLIENFTNDRENLGEGTITIPSSK